MIEPIATFPSQPGAPVTEPTGATVVTTDVGPVTTTQNAIEQAPEGLRRSDPIVQPVVEGVIYVDANGNGRQDGNEPSLPGVIIEVRDGNGALVATVRSGANGEFSQVVPGTGSYSVTIVAGVPPEYNFLTAQTIRVEVKSAGLSQAEFRVAISSDSLAFTGSNPQRTLFAALGLLLLGGALLSSRRVHRRR